MLASCSSECKDLSGESFCVHYKKLCTTNVNVKQACKKTCGLCKCYFQLVSTQFFGEVEGNLRTTFRRQASLCVLHNDYSL